MSSIVYFVSEQSLVTSLTRVPEEINIPMNNISSFTAIKSL